MNCPYCNSENTRKNGKSSNGSQIYKCKDCNRNFSDHSGANLKHVDNGICPNCKSKHVKYRGWNPSGSRRYECCDCGKCFSGKNIELDRQKEINCPHCNSKDIRRQGFSNKGDRRYHCKSCGKYFSNKTIIKEPINVICDKCGSKNVGTHGKTNKGKQIYQCRDCNHRFVEYKEPNFKKHDIICPRCGNIGARKSGTTGSSLGGIKQYYSCLSCGHKYLIDATNTTKEEKENIIQQYKQGVPIKHLAEIYNLSISEITRKVQGIPNPIIQKKERLKQLMIKEVLCGKSIKNIANKYGYNPKTLSKLMASEYVKEKINEEQKQLIIKFGIGCNVPIEYIAEYVPCSQYMCTKVLSNYDKLPKKKFEVDEKEKNWDKLWLDSFLT